MLSIESRTQSLSARRAVEALRSGVPSSEAVRALGSGQEALERRFRQLLERNEPQFEKGRQVSGLMVRGGFGEGKSHLLTCFEQIALDQGMAVTRVVVSKETPLQMPAKILLAACENLRLPGVLSRGLDEVGVKLAAQNAVGHGLTHLNSRFAASLHLYREAGVHNEELCDRIVRFWSGEKLDVSEMRRQLRELGEAQKYHLEPITARNLALETLTFLPLLLRSVGFQGLVLLIDEVELVGRYTRLGRGQSYCELARWMGKWPKEQRPGLITVGAVTSDYALEVLDGKSDRDSMGAFMRERRPEEGQFVEAGMALIDSAELLEAPTKSSLKRAYSLLKDLHAQAYGWEPPEVNWPETTGATPMRTFVRAWINAWDIRRLYPDSRADQLGYHLDQIRSSYETEAVDDEGPIPLSE